MRKNLPGDKTPLLHTNPYDLNNPLKKPDTGEKNTDITSVDHKGVTCYSLRGRGVESRSLMTSVETRDLSDRSRLVLSSYMCVDSGGQACGGGW